MSKGHIAYFEKDDVLHFAISDEAEAGSVEISPNITLAINLVLCVLMFLCGSTGCRHIELITHDDIKRKDITMSNVVDRRYGASKSRLQPRARGELQIDLSGKWQMAEESDEVEPSFGSGALRPLPSMEGWQWHEVTVPGSIRAGLLEAGVIADPYWSDNADKSVWTEEKGWWFRKSLKVPENWSRRQVFIGFDGVDYYSSLWFNGVFLGDHEGMVGGPMLDVTALVRPGATNEVIIKIHPGGTQEPGRVFKGYIFMKWHYQTDISPRGIWRKARMVATGPIRLEDPFVKTQSIDQQEALLELDVQVHAQSDAEPCLIKGTITGENFETEPLDFSLPVESLADTQLLTWPLTISKPKLW